MRSTVPKQILNIIKKMEEQSSHPIAQAIGKFSEEQKIECEDFKTISIDKSHHSGVTANIDGVEYSIGNSKMMKDLGIVFSNYEEEIKKQNAEHIIYFAKNKIVIGYILLEDPLREDAFDTVRELQNQGKHVHICTGADYTTAIKYADQLNIPHRNVMADCLGESKNSFDQTKTTYSG
jgi:P-type Cu2+ transporter